MGRAMAGRLLEAGHELTVYNRSSAAAEPFRAKGARIAQQPSEALGAEIVITMLADDAAIEAVWIGPGLIGKLPASGIHLNMASISVRLGKRLAELHQSAGSQYVSAPVFGRPPAAARGQLDIVAGGPEAAITCCQPLFKVLGRNAFTVGAEAYQANLVKITRNFLLATVIASLGEAFALVRKSGVDPAAFLNIITSTSFSAPVYKGYGRMMVDKAFVPSTFPLRLGLKDVELALAAGSDTGVPMPAADLIREQHLGAIASGFGEQDWAALGEYIAQNAGLK
jgi:3-hydroxyisobutyrate dehydrogenase-like beta-hydroxyacid dehydrogenase